MNAMIDSSAARKNMKRIRTALAGLLLALAAAGVVPAQTLYHASETASKAECWPKDFEGLACGAYGTFFVGEGELKSEAADCGLAAVSVDRGIYPKTAIEAFADAAAWVPCAGGSCFADEPGVR